MTPEMLVDRQLGPYTIEALLGSGGMAAVYQARVASQEPVALKVLFPPPNAGTEVRLRFEREARMAASLRHPSIVRVLEAGQADGYAYMAMTLINGETLADRLARQSPQPLDEQTAADIAWQIADALFYAHSQGIVHRDVKPSNILLRFDGQALLTDFGVAQVLDDPALTRTGHTVGTPAYMAPEQAVGDQQIDGRADLYALGVVLYHMVTGRPPFQGATPKVLHAHLYDPPPPPSSLTQLSPAMEKIINQALAKDVSQRFQSGSAMAQALSQLDDKTGTQIEIVPPDRSTETLYKAGYWFFGLLLVILGVLSIWQFGMPTTPASEIVDNSSTPTDTPILALKSSPTDNLVVNPTATPTPSPSSTPSPTATNTAIPTATATRTPTPTFTFTPLPPPVNNLINTPTLTATVAITTPSTSVISQTFDDCNIVVTADLTEFLNEIDLVSSLGCPVDIALTTVAARQPFERGNMLWRQDQNLVYILVEDNTWRSTGDAWRAGDLEFDTALTPPDGLLQPVRGFGLVWREQSGVQETLGWATAQEQGFEGLIQEFDLGLLLHDTERDDFFVLFNNRTYQSG